MCSLVLSRTLGVFPAPLAMAWSGVWDTLPSSLILTCEIAVPAGRNVGSLAPSRHQWPLCPKPGEVLSWVLCSNSWALGLWKVLWGKWWTMEVGSSGTLRLRRLDRGFTVTKAR